MDNHIYLSPHLDDAVFSCGGVIYQQTSSGEEVLVVTIFAGDPVDGQLSPYAQSLHERWGIDQASVESRRQEDIRACARLGAQYLHLSFPECIYRFGLNRAPYYVSDEALFGEVHPEEGELQEHIASKLSEVCSGEPSVYVPIAYGGHVDHQLVRGAVSSIKIKPHYYKDFPYAIRGEDTPSDWVLPSGEERCTQLTDQEFQIWAEAIKEYTSQLSTFWEDIQTIEVELRDAHDQMKGIPFIFPKKD